MGADDKKVNNLEKEPLPKYDCLTIKMKIKERAERQKNEKDPELPKEKFPQKANYFLKKGLIIPAGKKPPPK